MKAVIGAFPLLLLGLLPVYGQQDVNQTALPPTVAVVHQYFYDGSGNLTYDCQTPQTTAASTFSVALSSLTNISVTTNVGTITFTSTSYLWVGATIVVSGSATSALNATYKVTAVSGSTATITTSGVSNGTYTDPIITTSNPLLNSPIWAIKVNAYNGSNQLIGSYWANSTPGRGLACSARATY